MKTEVMKIGFTGIPNSQLINKYYNKYPNAKWIDLDVPYVLNPQTDTLPQTTCNIIKTILNNIYTERPDLVLFSIGYAKCDTATFLAKVIKEEFPDLKIIIDDNKDIKSFGTPISSSNLPLLEKFKLITEQVVDRAIGKIDRNIKQSMPSFGFWGVPPFDFDILKLFPNNTHVYGWTRLMENGTPNNLDLEMYVDNVPTVFFTQSFCSKGILAKSLAHKHNGLFVEVDGKLDNSTRAKIEAFLELSAIEKRGIL